MTNLPLSDKQRREICIRARAGESQRALAREYGTSARTVGRIALQDQESIIVRPKPVVRVRAVYMPMAGDISFKDWIKDNRLPLDQEPKPLANAAPLAPLGVSMSVQGAYRIGRQSNTADGAIIVFNSNERPTQVLRCPVYSQRLGACISRETVTITSVKGKTAKGRISQWSGEDVEGELFVFGVGGTVTRVEFFPDKVPAAYAREHKELRASLA